MRRLSQLHAPILAGVFVAVFGVATSSVTATPTTGDVRALWVPRASLTSPEEIATLVRSAQAAGFNTLLVQVRGRGEAYYRSKIEPRATDLERQPADFDPLAMTLGRAHAAGLAVHAWVNVNLVASPATLPRDRAHVALRHPEWLMVPQSLAAALHGVSPQSPAYLGALVRWTRGESERVEGLYLSPVLSEARAYTTDVIRELVEQYPLDGLHLDYVRYASDEFDYSAAALQEFRTAQLPRLSREERQRLDRAAAFSPAAWATLQPLDWSAFRRDRLTLLVAGVQAAARTARPGIIVSAAVLPSVEDARDRKLQDWAVWARAGYFDALCPMIYTTNPREFSAALRAMPALLGGTPFWAGIGAYRLPVAQTIDHVRLARRSGAAGVALFSYDKMADTGTAAASLLALGPVLLESPPAILRR